ncbi:MAG: hypothetical protein M1828_001839 [Chrysothrix sp. TS-e1954]|nr:MAG: hypothetical protein M1828_001839 [Chrysothrix sp. TS-e1954]
MISYLPRAVRSSALRVARQQHPPTARRALTSTSTRHADIIQDMYIKQLQQYRAPPVKPNDAEGHVSKFAVPTPPQSPEEAYLASSISEYEGQEVQIEGSSGEGAEAVTMTPEQKWFEDPNMIDTDEEDQKESGH